MGEPLEDGDRVEAIHFAFDEGLRIWPMWENGRPANRWRLVRVEGTGPDAVITELEQADNGHELEAKHPEARWGINDNETVPPGTQGTVDHVTAGQVSVQWDNGSSINLAANDEYRKV